MRPVDVEEQLEKLKRDEAKRNVAARAHFDLSARFWKALVNSAAPRLASRRGAN